MSDTTVIAEEKWWCWGNPNIPESERFNGAELLGSNGLMCCLGFESKQCGVPPVELQGQGLPNDIEGHYDEVAHLFLFDKGGISFQNRASEINDDNIMPYEKKKRALKELWAEYGWTLVFVKTVRGMNRKLKQLRG